MAAVGEVFGKYELLERIAVGGMAEVFRAESCSIGGFRKPVALKRVLPHLSGDAEFVSLFIQEAKLTVSLAHGNVVQVFDFGRIDSTYFLAMELVEGPDLTRVLTRQGRRGRPMPAEVALYVVAAVLRGLSHAHGRRDRRGQPLGIVHRDVSPHNVLLSHEGEVKLADFGIATAAAQVSLTRPSMRLGKFAYMSPEQARGEPVDHRTDIWAAGVTLWECLTGRRLFFDDDPSVILARVREPRVPPPSTLNPALGPRLDGLVASALAEDPEHRPSGARLFGADLQEELQRLSPGFDDIDLSRYLVELFDGDFGPRAVLPAPPSAVPKARPRLDTRADSSAPTRFQEPALGPGRPELDRLMAQFRLTPNLWTVVELGELLLRLGHGAEALGVHRFCADKFAQLGLRAQALRQWVRLRELDGVTPELDANFASLPHLEGIDNSALRGRIGRVGRRLSAFLEEVADWEEPGPAHRPRGLLDGLDGAELAGLGPALMRLQAAPEEEIVKEGEPGDRLYIIARGRVLIHCQGPRGSRVYLSALSDGDGFGERSFFTGEPRSASVEALDDVELLAVDRTSLEAVQVRFPRLTRALYQHHRRRTVSTLLAKSDVFGGLKAADREWLVDRMVPCRHASGAVIVHEGDTDRDAFFVVNGEVEVFRADRTLFLDKLRRGDLFGEGAIVAGRPRSASVRALGPVELLRLPADDLERLLAQAPEVRMHLERTARRRDAEAMLRVADSDLLP